MSVCADGTNKLYKVSPDGFRELYGYDMYYYGLSGSLK